MVVERNFRKKRVGVVISDKMNKTVVVKVSRRLRHSLLGKEITKSSKCYAHDDIGCKNGDVVNMMETRPLSKLKRWRVVSKVASEPTIRGEGV